MKKLVNKKIIKAMTIGISALMAANSMNLTVFAAEDTGEGVSGNNEEQTGSEQSQIDTVLEIAEQTQVDIVDAVEGENGIQDVIENAETVMEKTQTDELSEGTDELKSELDDTVQIPVSDVVPDENGDLNVEVNGTNEKIDAEEAISDVVTAIKELDNVDTEIKADVSVIEKQTEIANKAADDADLAAQEAYDSVVHTADDGSSVLLTDVTSTVLDALDEADKNISEATTKEDAKEAVDLAEAAVEAADKAITTAENGYNNAEVKYNEAKKIYDEAFGKVTDTKEALFGEGGALEKYESLKSIATADAQSASDELGILITDVDSLKDAADKLAVKAEGYKKIADLEANIDSIVAQNKEPSWDQYRELAKAIIEFYYVPDVLGGEMTSEIDWKSDWKNYEKKDYYGNGHVSDAADVLKYGEFTYSYTNENGETVEETKRINYKTAKGNVRKTGRGIVLFEKTEFETTDKFGNVQTQYSNQNWYDNNLILAQKDLQPHETFTTDEGSVLDVDPSANDDFRNRIENFTDIATKYLKFSEDVKTASDKLTEAKANVDMLIGQLQELCPELGDLSLEEIADMPVEEMTGKERAVLKEFGADLTEAKQILDEAKKQKKEADEKLETIKADFAKKSAELEEQNKKVPDDQNKKVSDEKPSPVGIIDDNPVRREFTGDVYKFVENNEEADAVVENIPDEVVPMAEGIDAAEEVNNIPADNNILGPVAAPAIENGGAVVDDNADIAGVTDEVTTTTITENIDNEVTPLTETIPTDEKKIYDIVNDPTALAELIEEPGVHIGWYWWILIIAALGATGWALYRKYKKNKAVEANGGRK